MTVRQKQAIWELCRQGFPLAADEAAECWEDGERYAPNGELRVPLEVEQLLETCNWEICPRAQ
jgi:hypothetical protein